MMSDYHDLLEKAKQLEDELAKQGIIYPKRCNSCTDLLEGNETFFCDECKAIMEKELADGNVYLGGNVKRPNKIIH